MAIFGRKKPEGAEGPSPTRGSAGRGYLYLAIILILAVAVSVLLILSFRKVEPDQVGLRVVKFGFGLFKNGAEFAKPLPPGYHPIFPGFHEFVVYQKNLQAFEMTSKSGGMRQPDYPSLEIRTSDGYKVNVDITIFYHILEGKANLARSYYRNDQEIKEKGLQAVAPGILQNKLSELAYAQDFYNSKLRVEKIDLARKMLNQHFAQQGIEIMDIVIRDFEFPQEYEAAILRKVLAEQLKRVQESLAKAAEAEAGWKKIIAEGNRDAEVTRAEGQTDAWMLEADGERMKTELSAQGEKAKLLAEAKGKKQIVNALSSSGGKVYVGLEYAKVFQGLDLIILPSGKGGINPFDVNQQVRQIENK